LKKLGRVVASLVFVGAARFAKNAPLGCSSFTELGVVGALKKALGSVSFSAVGAFSVGLKKLGGGGSSLCSAGWG
jgi:hypothetical protein